MDDRVSAFLESRSAGADQWSDWGWQMRNRISSVNGLSEFISVDPEEERGIARTASRYAWTVTPYYASLMQRTNAQCPIRLQAIPSANEVEKNHSGGIDPVGDRSYGVTNRVIHKYPDRAIVLVTSRCPVLCRFCTRKHHTTAYDSTYFQEGEAASWEADFDYLRRTESIRDVLLTGGDPLTYSDAKLERIISELRSIPHIEIIRIGSRYPVLLPFRITDEFCAMLARYHPVWLNTHFNHPNEISPEAEAACSRLLSHGIPVGNQTVLLKGVNDDRDTLMKLFRRLVAMRVRPYYLYHCDNVEGVGHFQTTIDEGRAIMRGLTGYTTGFAVPQYVITTDKGKIPLAEDNVIEFCDDGGSVRLRSYTGEIADLRLAQSD
jgi:lysine 2,3-aminomutase